MKELLLDYAQYNVWANQKICNFLKTLSEEQLTKEIASSFSSIQKTMIHVWDAQYLWLKRLNGESPTGFPGKNFSGMFDDVVNGIRKTSEELENLAIKNNEPYFQTMLSYKNVAGEPFTNKIGDIFQHVINHGTYHRGQVITLLHQSGITQLFSTDYIIYCREEKKVTA